MAMRDKINVKTSSTNIELNDSAKQKHEGNFRSLKYCLISYKIIPFSGGPVKVITSGVEAGSTIIKGSLRAPEKGDEIFLKFVENRITNRTESLNASINRQRINTGASKLRKLPRTISVLKDVQAFGLLVKNVISMEEAF